MQKTLKTGLAFVCLVAIQLTGQADPTKSGTDDGFTMLPKSSIIPATATPLIPSQPITVPTNQPNVGRFNATNRVPIIGQEAVAQAEATAVLNDMLKKHPERLIRLKAAILKANQDPTIQGELSDARKRIRNYIIQNDPADIDLLEALTRARTIQQHNNREAQAIY
jgi:formaldehyde-activating enzyme involved in methanogenesis